MENRSGITLKRLRKKRKMSLRELARRCKIDSSNLCKIEKGKERLPIKHFYNISKELELTFRETCNFLSDFKYDKQDDVREELRKIKYWGNV